MSNKFHQLTLGVDSCRVRQDLIDLRANDWVPRIKVEGPATKEEIRLGAQGGGPTSSSTPASNNSASGRPGGTMMLTS